MTEHDTNATGRNRRPAMMIGLFVVALALGILLAQLLPANLLGLRHDATHDEEVVDAGSAAEGDQASGQLWTCGMHPHVIEDEPGQCPICGMDLTPMRGSTASTGSTPVTVEDAAHAAGGSSVVEIDPAVVQNMNVRTAVAERRDLTRPIRTVGYLEFDQQRMVTVTTKYSGWVEKVYVNYVGEKVRRGQSLFEIYSPELVQTEQELLSAIAFADDLRDAPADALERAQSMVQSARTRLGYWDISPRQIAHLEETGEVFRTLAVAAPSNGLVMKRMAGLEGMAVTPGMELFHIADLSSLWLSVELFEDQLAWVREGTDADIELSYFPGERFTGKVRYLEPELSETTRTMRAKIEVPNRDGLLRKGMYATVNLQPVAVEDALAVPTQSVLRTGERQVVIEALGNGRFVPHDVTLGHEADGYTQILTGLEAGAEVVTAAQFLLDSESTLRAAIQRMAAER